MNEHIYEQKQIGKYTVKVLQDDDPINPREEWDNLCTMVCFHRRYNLGDKHNFSDSDELKEFLKKRKDILWLPLFLYDHSGLTMSTRGFSCPWDSGQVGIIYMEKAVYRKEFNKKRVNKKHVYNILRSEVSCYDDYLTGNIYGFIVEDEEGAHVDSCWGFFGDYKDCLAEGISMAQYNIKQDIKNHVEQVKTWIRNKVPLNKRYALEV